MTRRLCIDLRWIDCSGIGTYIQGVVPVIVERLRDVTIVGLGPKRRLVDFSWSSAENFLIKDCNAGRYSVREQIELPLAIPNGTDLFFSPHYPIPLLYRGRLIVTVHDVGPLVLPEIVGSVAKRIYAKVMFREVRRRAALILTNSEFTRNELLTHTHGCRTDNIVSAHLGVAQEWFREGSAETSSPYFVYVGNIKPHKNLGRLLEAFRLVAPRIPHRFVIVGQKDGFISPETDEFWSSLKNAGDRVQATGHVSFQKLLRLVRGASGLVMPSVYEGFGFPPIEAMAAGIPTLVANSGSLPEICGDASLYCDPYDVDDIAAKLLTLLTDEGVRRVLLERGRARAAGFSWSACGETTARTIRTVLL